jgi:hypothetical protein
MQAEEVQAGRQFFWERVGSAMRMSDMRFDTNDHIELPGAFRHEFLTGRVGGRDLKLGSYMHQGEQGSSPYSAVLAAVDGLPDDVEVSVDRLGAVATGRLLRERVRCAHAKDKIVIAPASTTEIGGLALVVGADIPSFIEQATDEVLCSLHGGIRIIDGRHWVGVASSGDPYPSKRTLKRAIAGNAKALASIRIDVEDMVDHVQTVVRDAAAIDRRFSVFPPRVPPPRSRTKKRR